MSLESDKGILIIGASHAGSQAAVSLRQAGYLGPITLLGDELDLPYHRPPLSKDFITGSKEIRDILLRPETAYQTANIELRLGEHVTEIDRKSKVVLTKNHEIIKYETLILAMGARARRLNIPGANTDKVFYLRNAHDVRAIRNASKPGKRAVIIGGGYIGLETAASLKKQGLKVTVLEAMDRILKRVTAPVMSDFYRRVHSEEGVKIVENEMASLIEESEGELIVHSTNGSAYTADFVIAGIGIVPNTEMASDADLETSNGVVINEYCQTSDPSIYAIGDVSWHYNSIYNTHLRLESVPNATEQAKTAAGHICGKPKPHNTLPWFWSDQFNLKLQIAGLFQGFDDIVVRGDPQGTERSFSVFYFKGDNFLAVDAVNSPKAFMMSRMVLTKGQELNKKVLSDTSADLKSAVI